MYLFQAEFIYYKDVYDAIPTIVTTFVAMMGKISLFVFLFELTVYTGNTCGSDLMNWSNNLIVSSILSLVVGSFLGLIQHSIKSLYAFSSISHIGFVLLALAVNTSEASSAFFFYLITYSFSNLNAFFILIAAGYTLSFYTSKFSLGPPDRDIDNLQYLSQLKGYFLINPVLAISFIITLFSFIGMPPLVGFFGKQMVLSVAMDNGYLFATAVAIITSVIGAVYYLNFVKFIVFDQSFYYIYPKFLEFPDWFNLSSSYMIVPSLRKKISGFLTFIISMLTLALLSFMFSDQQLLNVLYFVDF